jgi:SAM-dependent methyltransferase
LRAHYEIEKELASRLRSAEKHRRRGLYTQLYDELFRRVPDHVQLVTKESPQVAAHRVRLQLDLLQRFLQPATRFAEIGPGDCALSYRVASEVREVHGVDVSGEITKCAAPPANFTLHISDGTSVPVPAGSMDLIYSNQLMEHLHPEDAFEQLENVFRALAPGGLYVCVTPSRLNGPHDVSRYFDTVATGFHLKEYTAAELAPLFARVGFRNLKVAIGGRSGYWLLPAALVAPLERMVDTLPLSLRNRITKTRLGRAFFGVRLIARKPM